MWEHGKDWSMVNDEKLNLDLIYDGYTDLFFKKDFFYYVGSLSEPPCTEGVHRFVMSNHVYVKHA
jgi:carbonic anhydrase